MAFGDIKPTALDICYNNVNKTTLQIHSSLLVQTLVPCTKLENVEHCGGEPEQADRILMSDVTYSTFGVQCKLTQWNPH